MSACEAPVTEAGGGSPTTPSAYQAVASQTLLACSVEAGARGRPFFWLKYCSELVVVSADSVLLRLLLAVDPPTLRLPSPPSTLAQQEPTSCATGRARLIVGHMAVGRGGVVLDRGDSHTASERLGRAKLSVLLLSGTHCFSPGLPGLSKPLTGHKPYTSPPHSDSFPKLTHTYVLSRPEETFTAMFCLFYSPSLVAEATITLYQAQHEVLPLMFPTIDAETVSAVVVIISIMQSRKQGIKKLEHLPTISDLGSDNRHHPVLPHIQTS